MSLFAQKSVKLFKKNNDWKNDNFPFGFLPHSRIENMRTKKWYQFRVTNFYYLMRPCIFFCQLLGVFPYRFYSTGFTSSKIYWIYGTLFTTFGMCMSFQAFYRVHISHEINYKSGPSEFQGDCYLICFMFILFATYIHNRPRMRLLKDLLDLSSTLPPEAFTTFGRIFYIKDIFGFFFLFGQVLKFYNEDIDFFFYKFYSIYTILMVFTMDMLYVNCVCALKMCFREIRNGLFRIKDKIVQGNVHSLLIIELRGLQKRHLTTSDVLSSLNSVFSWHLIASIILTFVEIVFSSYFYILIESGVPNDDDGKQTWYTFCTTPLVYYSVKIVFITWACEAAKSQAMDISRAIHELIVVTDDKQFRRELNLFALQTLQRSNKFTATGLTLDASFLTSLIAGIATYLLILIQVVISTYENIIREHNKEEQEKQ